MSDDVGVIAVRYTNLYKFPVVDGNVITSLCKGTKLTILGESDEFFQVGFGKQLAYVLKQCIYTRRQYLQGQER